MSAEVAERNEKLLNSLPEFVCFQTMMKATPVEEAGERMVYIQASDETRDAQGERVLRSALEQSAEVFKTYGVLDIDHYTMLGPKSGIPNYREYEIGRPIDVNFRGDKTFVKAQLYRGDTPLARNAEMVWDSLTKLNPPARWYPSVGGQTQARRIEADPKTGEAVPVITSVRWVNLALSRTPVNQSVPTVQTVPFGSLTKSWTAAGLNLSKALEAGYGTDSAALSGGAALREQSLDPHLQSYWDFRDIVAKEIRGRRIKGTAADIVEHAHQSHGLSKSLAAEWAERFHADLRAGLHERIH